MTDKVIFNLKKYWVNPANYLTGETSKIVDLYEEIKAGRKTSEWRGATKFWLKRLLTKRLTPEGIDKVLDTYHKHGTQDLTCLLRVHTAWFLIGYPKGSLPRLEADITALLFHRETDQLEIKFANVRETLT